MTNAWLNLAACAPIFHHLLVQVESIAIDVAKGLFVRINPLRASTPFSVGCGADDIVGVVQPGLRGIILPKAESVDDIELCDSMIYAAEMSQGIKEGSIELYAIIETAIGVLCSASIARARVRRPFRLCFGAGDFTTDIGVAWTREEQESRVARSMLVMASRAARLPQPIDSVFVDISDSDGLHASARMALGLGFCGKFVIHPLQVQTVKIESPEGDMMRR